MGYGQTRFGSPDLSFKLAYIARNLMTGIAETIVRDRFEDQTERRLHVSEVLDWSVSTIVVREPLILVDLRTTGLLRLGVTTDASRAKAQEAGRRLIPFPGDQLALAMGGHQWKPALPLRVCRSSASWAHRCETMASSVSRSGMCLLTTGSSTTCQ
ncbi:RES family NAD+ phosphorylase, partial [Roseiarcus fermentans]|uniref:RES family NAD+ phosphorylase n=1 Tax=Roseiarcus fermentans TaxID=1473586 RepID=UPI001472D9FF